MAKNIAESIPSFLREFYLHHSPRHGLATPEAFRAAIGSAFNSNFALSTHPLVYAIRGSFFRYAPSIPTRAPWSLPPPNCSFCGPQSTVRTVKFHPSKNPTTARFQCETCRRTLRMVKPEGVRSCKHFMWETEWDTYLKWNKDISEATWDLGQLTPVQPQLTTERIAMDDFVERFLGDQNEFTKECFRSLNPNLPLKKLHNILGMMGIAKQHLGDAVRILKMKPTAKPTALESDSMDTSQ